MSRFKNSENHSKKEFEHDRSVSNNVSSSVVMIHIVGDTVTSSLVKILDSKTDVNTNRVQMAKTCFEYEYGPIIV